MKKGDEVTVTSYESIVFQLFKPGEATPGFSGAQTGDRARLGEKPGAGEAETLTMTATVEKVDKVTPSVTLQRSDGTIGKIRPRARHGVARSSVSSRSLPSLPVLGR